MRKLNAVEKTQISAGFSPWLFSICFSLIADVVINVVNLIANLVMSSQQQSAASEPKNNYHNTFGSSVAYMKISKYPSQANLRVGLPWM